jgi:hypothetical protein
MYRYRLGHRDWLWGDIYRRLLGWPKTYWPYKKMAAILSIIAMHVAFVVVAIMRIPVYAHYRAKKKYSGWS